MTYNVPIRVFDNVQFEMEPTEKISCEAELKIKEPKGIMRIPFPESLTRTFAYDQ